MPIEILSPAGSFEGVRAAVKNGADAVYLGLGGFNARQGAKNLTPEELSAAVSYCHVRGAKVYVTLNTLVTDREMPSAAETARIISESGADAVLVQDIGVAMMVREVAPDLEMHASTQMTVHNVAGARAAAGLGFKRVVAAREMNREQLRRLCAASPIDVEVFLHGALCFCYSGQCYFSAVIGGRSGNRGMCAQPCRLAYGFGERGDEYPLSLKDLSLAVHLSELEQIGVKCLKIEGRMKRPEYSAIVTGIYSRAVKERREPTAEEIKTLERVFSRDGFTDGYYTGNVSKEMLGTRGEANANDTQKLFASARAEYMSERENPRVGVTFATQILAGKPAALAVSDSAGNRTAVYGEVPQSAQNRELLAAEVTTQLYKTGGTPYFAENAKAQVESGLSLPVSEINALRRRALDELTTLRARPPLRSGGEYTPPPQVRGKTELPRITVQAMKIEQISAKLLEIGPTRVYLPLSEIVKNLERTAEIAKSVPVAAVLPRICGDHQWKKLSESLDAAKDIGIRDAVIGNLGMIFPAAERGFRLRGDYGLNIFNSAGVAELAAADFVSATLSFELTFAQIRDIGKPISCEILAYGRLPLMITEQCVVKNKYGKCVCDNSITLVDRKNAAFPVMREFGHRNVILNSQKLFLADKSDDFAKLGLSAIRLMFTTENPREAEFVLNRYKNGGAYEPNAYTRGLYYRGFATVM